MLDNLRLSFKTSRGMSVKENLREVNTTEFLKGFKRSQKSLSKNGQNRLTIESHHDMPVVLCIQQLNVKRVVNNLLSNSLKHTRGGQVSLYTGLVESDEIELISIEECIHIGARIIPDSI